MIELKNINKSYGSLEVLKNINLTIEKGEITAIVGPSGAGKTTLLQIAGSLDLPTSGDVLYDNMALTSLSDTKLAEFRNKNIGFVFQFHELLPEFTTRENVALPALIMGIKRKDAYNEADRLLSSLGLQERLNHLPSELSGGEKQRTAIARALINNPRIIFADEPTGSLDSHNREEIQNIIINLCKNDGYTFLIVTHDPSLASIADRVITMEDGKITSSLRREEMNDSINQDDSSSIEEIVETDLEIS